MRDAPVQRAGIGAGYRDDDLLPLSGIQHFSYCERQWALIHIECLWEENLDTTLGKLFHERAHLSGYSCAKGVIAERSLRLLSRELGVVGFADVVEFVPCDEGKGLQRDGSWYVLRPVEYKKGRTKAGDHDRLQLAAQAMCLEEMYGIPVVEGCLFYGETRRRERVELGESLRRLVRSMADRMHELSLMGATPRVTEGSRCARCSLKNACFPEMFSEEVSDYWKGLGVDWGTL